MKKNLIVDCFAGGGGASVGIEVALGRPVDIAINHDPDESYAAENKYDGLKATKITFRCNTNDGKYYDTNFFDLCQKCMKEILDIMNLDEEGEKKSK